MTSNSEAAGSETAGSRSTLRTSTHIDSNISSADCSVEIALWNVQAPPLRFTEISMYDMAAN
jgi:hypothetical protein